MWYCYIIIVSAIFSSTFYSCNKDNSEANALFYGKWKTSYGDTIQFANEGGKDMLRYDVSGSAAVPGTGYYEFTYRYNKLGMKDELSSLGRFRFLQSFRWLDTGRSFEVQGIEWFTFMSSTNTYFTITKIP
jgi:hypothetical protein